MMLVNYFPIVYATARATVAYQVAKHIKSAVPIFIGAVRERLSCFLSGALTEMTLSILLLLAAACWAEHIFGWQETLVLVCSIYAGSILRNVSA